MIYLSAITECTQELREFQACDSLTVLIKDLEEFRSRLPVPEQVPTSHAELRLMLLEVSLALNHYMEIKDFSACAELNTKQTRLESYKYTFPSPMDLQKEIDDMHRDLDEAMKAKNFKRCAELNEQISKMVLMRQELNEDDFVQFYALETLFSRKSEIEAKIADAMTAKRFDECDRLQKTLDAIQSNISSRKPLDVDVDILLGQVEASWMELNSEKKFADMAVLAQRREDLLWLAAQKQPEASASRTTTSAMPQDNKYSSYTYEELSEAIDMNSKLLEDFVRNKQFSR